MRNFISFLLVIFFLPSSTTALWSRQPSSQNESENDDNSFPVDNNFWPSWDSLPYAKVPVMQWNANNHNNRDLLGASGNFPGDELIVTVAFEDVYKVILFMAVAWLMGALSVFVGLPCLVGEIATGFLLGPPLADVVPYPGALVLLGDIGLIGLILEAGISLDLPQLKENGQRALMIATIGTVLPLVAGFSVGRWIGQDVPSAIAAGAAFASTSLGVASNALNTGDVINTPLGQLIVTSSVFDDVFALILLSILQVISNPESQTFDYILPFISSFGYILVLGFLGVTVLPRLIEDKILPLAPEKIRDQFAMVLLLLFVTVYMIMLNKSKASYLTGAFLAGLTFCKLHSVHAFFVKHGQPIHSWLLRVFFSATIGFQVPITRFQDPFVLKWGCAFLIATFAKMPIGLMAPRYKGETPKDFPYNPYYRDVIVTSLSMACRGEFNVIVAAYSLSQGLFVPDVYSAVMFAIMCGAIIAPLMLAKVLKYYNRLSAGYMKGKHLIERIGDTDDGYRPLFLAIQSRTPVHWNLHESFQNTLEEMGLVIIDHRSFHTLDRNDQSAVDITELFVQDTKMKVRIRHCFGKSNASERNIMSSRSLIKPAAATVKPAVAVAAVKPAVDFLPSRDQSDRTASSLEGMVEERDIEERCLAIKEALSHIFKEYNPEEYAIQVSQWMAFVVDASATNSERSSYDEVNKNNNRDRFYSFQTQPFEHAPATETIIVSSGDVVDVETADAPETPRQPVLRRSATVGSNGAQRSAESRPYLASSDLWEYDDGCMTAAFEGDFLAQDSNCGERILIEGVRHPLDGDHPAPRGHRRAVTFDASQLLGDEGDDRETAIFHDRLHGYVRQTSLQPPSPTD